MPSSTALLRWRLMGPFFMPQMSSGGGPMLPSAGTGVHIVEAEPLWLQAEPASGGSPLVGAAA